MPRILNCLLTLAIANIASSKLLKVVVLGRHGNRAPNPQVPAVCPKANDITKGFKEPVWAHMRAALSRVGMAQCYQGGLLLKERYRGEGKLLPDGPYDDDGSTFFFSERMNRNIQSANAVLQGLYPAGTGPKGFIDGRPNMVPVLTTLPFHDELMNLPRDGPCKSRYNADTQAWNTANTARVLKDNNEILKKFSEVCGFDFTQSPNPLVGKTLSWSLKAAGDLFKMAPDEGIKTEQFIDPKLRDSIIGLAGNMTGEIRFKKEHQLVYWIGAFLDKAVFGNLREPSDRDVKSMLPGASLGKPGQSWADTPKEYFFKNKFLMFMNHRELLTSIMMVLEVLDGAVPAGGMVMWELHENDNGDRYVKMLAWQPDSPNFDVLHRVQNSYEDGADMGSLFEKTGRGKTTELFPPKHICAVRGKCTLEELEGAFRRVTDRVGTYQEVCGLGQRTDDLVTIDGDDSSAPLFFEQQLIGNQVCSVEANDVTLSSTKVKENEEQSQQVSIAFWAFGLLTTFAAFGAVSLLTLGFFWVKGVRVATCTDSPAERNGQSYLMM